MGFEQQYERYCERIEKEDKLISERMNWLLLSQTLLFGSLGLSRKETNISDIIPFVGLFTSIFLSLSIIAAILTSQSCRKYIVEKNAELNETELREYPQIQRNRTHLILGFLAPIAVPLVFAGSWLFIIYQSVVNRW